MSTRITLIATAGPLTGQEYAFTGRTLCLVGRSSDCQLQLPGGDELALTASRRHCLLDIDLPFARVRDLGSLNGTFVNGQKVGPREKGRPAHQADPAETELHDGDVLAVGNSQFLIDMSDSPFEETFDAPQKDLEESLTGATDVPAGRQCAVCG